MKFRFHVVSLPHTQTTKDFGSCAFTEKVRKFCMMMKAQGHTVYLYASEENEAPCDELITCISKEEQEASLEGKHYTQASFDSSLPHWRKFNANVIKELRGRLEERDFICIIGGLANKSIADAYPKHMTIEFGIGYPGVFAPFQVYESYAWMHTTYGSIYGNAGANGRFFDAVIPSYFEPSAFPFRDKKDDFYLYIGRITERKGFQTAVDVTKKLNKKLVLAGAADVPLPDYGLYMGIANAKQRGELMSRAKAVFVPTIYIEPFGSVAVEAMMCGTPVIATDFGAFPETVVHGLSGYRFRTFGEAVWGAKNVHKLDSARIRKYAIDNYSINRIKYLYQAYFEQLYTLWDENGWYSNWHAGVSKYNRYGKILPD